MESINIFRKQIQKLDGEIIKRLARRMKLSQKIGKIKKRQRKPVLDAPQEKKLLNYHLKLAASRQLEKKLVERLFKLIINHSKKLQKL